MTLHSTTPEDSSPCLQDDASCSYPKPAETNPHSPSYLLTYVWVVCSHFVHSLIHTRMGLFSRVRFRFVQLTTNLCLMQKLIISGFISLALHTFTENTGASTPFFYLPHRLSNKIPCMHFFSTPRALRAPCPRIWVMRAIDRKAPHHAMLSSVFNYTHTHMVYLGIHLCNPSFFLLTHETFVNPYTYCVKPSGGASKVYTNDHFRQLLDAVYTSLHLHSIVSSTD
jgi:hypothetical protein